MKDNWLRLTTGFDCLRGTVMLKMASASVSCKLLSWNLCIVLTRCPKVLSEGQRSSNGGVGNPRPHFFEWPGI